MTGIDETWRPVVGWEQYYQVSTLGRVRSNDRQVIRTHTSPYIKKGVILKTQEHRQGYRVVTLSAEGTSQTVKIHRLVAEAFIPNPDKLPLVLHGRNGISDNSYRNLRWGTHVDNNRDTVRDGMHWQVHKTECPRGHEYTGRNNVGSRICRICQTEASRRHRERRTDGRG